MHLSAPPAKLMAAQYVMAYRKRATALNETSSCHVTVREVM